MMILDLKKKTAHCLDVSFINGPSKRTAPYIDTTPTTYIWDVFMETLKRYIWMYESSISLVWSQRVSWIHFLWSKAEQRISDTTQSHEHPSNILSQIAPLAQKDML